MQIASLILLLAGFGVLAFVQGRLRSLSLARHAGGIRFLSALPFYYGLQSLFWTVLPSLILLAVWLLFRNTLITHLVVNTLPPEIMPTNSAEQNLIVSQLHNIAAGALSGDSLSVDMQAAADRLIRFERIGRWVISGALLSFVGFGLLVSYRRISLRQNARVQSEQIIKLLLLACASIAIFTTAGIVFSVIFESIQFFKSVSPVDFVFGLEWSPQTAIRADQVGSSGLFGAIPLFVGTLLITLIAMVIAVPVGLMSAIYLAEYAKGSIRTWIKPALEILAGIPTVVYGFFAALTVAPALRNLGESVGLSVSSESALAAGAVMGIMIIPFISSLADDVITAVPRSLRDGSLAMGATQSETILKVVFPAALPGIVGGILLAVSRAIGETMIVVMAAGLAANLTANPLETVTTVTVQIVTLLTGDQEFDSPKTLAAFALGLMLFVVTLALNFIALKVVKKYREQYD